jgi:predicted membrane protein
MKDQLGAMCSGLCIVHCLVTPVILAVGASGIVATIFATELFHQLLVIPVSLLLLLTLIQSYKEHAAWFHLLMGVVGVSLLIAAFLLNEQYEVMLTIVGGTLLITYHLFNLRQQQKRRFNLHQQHKRRLNKLRKDKITS